MYAGSSIILSILFFLKSLQEEILRVMQRNHSVKESLQCLEKAQKIYSQNVSVDLIFAFPDQTLKS